MNIKAVLFDVNGTLIDIETDEGMVEAYRAIAHFLLYQGVVVKSWSVRDLYFEVMKEQLVASTEQYPEFNVVLVWKEILHRLGVCCVPLEKMRQLPLLLAEVQRGICRKRLKCFPDAAQTLATLRKHYRLAIVSDGQTAYAFSELTGVGLREFFSPIIVSGDYGYRKPDSRLFHHALNHLRVDPAEAIFVGNDYYRDIFGAREAGMGTVLFAPQGQPSPAGQPEPDYILYKLADLPAAVDFFTCK